MRQVATELLNEEHSQEDESPGVLEVLEFISEPELEVHEDCVALENIAVPGDASQPYKECYDTEEKVKEVRRNPTFLTEIEDLEDNNKTFNNEKIEDIDEPKPMESEPTGANRISNPNEELLVQEESDKSFLDTDKFFIFVLFFAVYCVFSVLKLKLSQLLNLCK